MFKGGYEHFSLLATQRFAKAKGKKGKGKRVFNSHFGDEPRSAGIVE